MDSLKENKLKNILKLLRERESHIIDSKKFTRQLQITEEFISRLGLQAELDGHRGCVNCLEWSKDGLRLASGSDDTNIIIWDPYRHKLLQTILTPHVGNIFTVKFLGGPNDPLIVSGAGDCHVTVQSIDQEPGDLPILNCACHAGRVKRIVVCPEQPQMFWSAGEDGCVMQYDLREPHNCGRRSTVFVDLTRSVGWSAEAKCIAVNPVKTHLIAVGANDCFVRLFDRRMVTLNKYPANHFSDHRERNGIRPDPNVEIDCVKYLAPGHLAYSMDDVRYKFAVTYLTFDSLGNELLVNMGGDQIFLFDINSTRETARRRLQIPKSIIQDAPDEDDDDDEKKEKEEEVCKIDHSKIPYIAIDRHSLRLPPNACTCQFLDRARILLNRKWVGDAYASLREYLSIIERWHNAKEAYLGLIQALIQLKWINLANVWLNFYRDRFPLHSYSSQAMHLKSEIARLMLDGYNGPYNAHLPEDELRHRNDAVDYERRYVGHCNTTTDIKEANFLGPEGHFIIAGSDDGIFFIWNRETTEIVKAMWGDVSIVNCVQPSPNSCLLATSGIDSVVKLWAPLPEGTPNSRKLDDPYRAVVANQKRISMDPFETMLSNMGYNPRNSDDELDQEEVPSCRPS